MTTIAWDGKTLAADSAGTCGNLLLRNEKKIYIIGKRAIIATSGEIQDGFLFRKWFKDGCKPADFPSTITPESSESIIVTKDGAFINWGKPVLIPIEPKRASGSGSYFAVSAMHLGKTAIDAVLHASNLDCYTKPPIQFAFFDENGRIIEGVYHGDD